MPYPTTPDYGVSLTGPVTPFPAFHQPTDAPVLGPDPIVGADGTVTYDGLDTLVLRWAGPWEPAWLESLVDTWQAAQAAGGRAQVRYYSDRDAAMTTQTGVPLRPTYAYRSGLYVYDLEWVIQGLGLI